MDYIEQWQLMREKSKERANKVILIYALNNPYGYKLNVSHPQIRAMQEKYRLSHGIHRTDMANDKNRREFEKVTLESDEFKALAKSEAEKHPAAYKFINRIIE